MTVKEEGFVTRVAEAEVVRTFGVSAEFLLTGKFAFHQMFAFEPAGAYRDALSSGEAIPDQIENEHGRPHFYRIFPEASGDSSGSTDSATGCADMQRRPLRWVRSGGLDGSLAAQPTERVRFRNSRLERDARK